MQTPKIYSTLERALTTPLAKTNVYFPFLVSQEVENGPTFLDELGNSHTQTRRYLAFKDVKEYMSLMEHYPHCHELVVPLSSNNSMVSCTGRVAFDFDLPLEIPHGFKQHIQSAVSTLFKLRYKGVDVSKFEFVWLSCENPKKTSLHLIVKNACLYSDWPSQLRSIYTAMAEFLPTGFPTMDMALARRASSLRLPLSSKIGGCPMVFDSGLHSFEDGLICVRDPEQRRHEQLIWKDQEISYVVPLPEIPMPLVIGSDHQQRPLCELEMSDVLVEDAFELFHRYNDPSGWFQKSGVVGRFISLSRMRPSRCIVSGDLHERDNAYLFISPKDGNVYFGCQRRCRIPGTSRALRILSK